MKRGAIGRILSGVVLCAIWLYRNGISPYLTPSCRFFPSCSSYAEEAVRRLGPWRGIVLATRRLLRCHPFGRGGFDPLI